MVKRKKEQQKYGVFFDDEYDYLQHLRVPESQNVAWEYVSGPKPIDKTVDERKKPLINLPSSVFASEFEEKEGLLRKSAPRHGPRPDWDPDIVAALDDDFDFENPQNELDDNFMEMAMEGVAAGREFLYFTEDRDLTGIRQFQMKVQKVAPVRTVNTVTSTQTSTTMTVKNAMHLVRCACMLPKRQSHGSPNIPCRAA